ncbi:LUD domain-containing protein [Nocardioides panacis]|uniref:LUD domain-containing protein n=1 Tax=Nocardioides panacis TaxID=2849501 RepID=A0A975SY62_9ACTN|nr:LUD domain-containing protein [Nocardioides panacis]QWZ08125.1 LUD domain-containing protein [Nocardioides panacis]
MTEAREAVLANVRRALAAADTSPVTVPRSYRDAGTPDPAAMLDLFVERVADYRATVVRCAAGDVEARIAAALPDGARVLVPDGLPWQVPGAVADSGPTGLSSAELDGLDAVVTAATVGIATTGTIVLSHGPAEGRRAVSLVPDLHVCVVRADQVVADVPEAVALLDPGRPTTWISGPSATSDIELDRVEGVHGPRTLHVLVVS